MSFFHFWRVYTCIRYKHQKRNPMSSTSFLPVSPDLTENLYLASNKKLLPREKMEKMGASAMSNEELLALILGSGCQDCDVFELSRNLAVFLSEETEMPTLQKLRQIRGLGRAKATQVLACLELSAITSRCRNGRRGITRCSTARAIPIISAATRSRGRQGS